MTFWAWLRMLSVFGFSVAMPFAMLVLPKGQRSPSKSPIVSFPIGSEKAKPPLNPFFDPLEIKRRRHSNERQIEETKSKIRKATQPFEEQGKAHIRMFATSTVGEEGRLSSIIVQGSFRSIEDFLELKQAVKDAVPGEPIEWEMDRGY